MSSAGLTDQNEYNSEAISADAALLGWDVVRCSGRLAALMEKTTGACGPVDKSTAWNRGRRQSKNEGLVRGHY